jgi:hypothetical protein
MQEESQKLTRHACDKPNLVQYISESYNDENRLNLPDGSQSSEVSQYFVKNSDTDEPIEDYYNIQVNNPNDTRIRILDEARHLNYERKVALEEPSISKQVIIEH